MIRLAPELPTVTALAQQLSVRPSTLMSRFARAGLPSPKNYLAAVRLLHAAFLFETAGLSVADVAYRLEYSSPQSFGRHLRAMLGLTALEFRRRFPFPVALERFVDLMMAPYREVWRTFHPLAAGSGESGRVGGAGGRKRLKARQVILPDALAAVRAREDSHAASSPAPSHLPPTLSACRCEHRPQAGRAAAPAPGTSSPRSWSARPAWR